MSVVRSTPAGLAGAVLGVTCWAAGNVLVVKAPMDGLQIAFWRILLGAVVYARPAGAEIVQSYTFRPPRLLELGES